ncbi:MAG: protoporphyrinogen oxidase [Pyrinomonadaceae bacterium]
MDKRVCVVGGGISGLCVAYRLQCAGLSVTLFEKSDKTGGNITTLRRDGFLYELGPNSVLTSRDLLDLIIELDLLSEIAKPEPQAKHRFIVRGGKLVELPSSVAGFLGTKAFSTRAKLRLLKEPFVRRDASETESVADFFERRLGPEIVDYAVDPFVSGIYAGDPATLSLRHAFPKLYELEREFGSLAKGALLSKKDRSKSLPKGTPRSLSFKRGMQTLSDALTARLGRSVNLLANVLEVRESDGTYQVVTEDGEQTFNAVVMATPAQAASGICAGLDDELSATLDKIYYAPVAVVFTAFKQSDIAIDPKGFGFLVPGIEKRHILGSLWTSSVFENRAPDGYHIFTTFVGGSRNAELCTLSENELTAISIEELYDLMGATGEPVFTEVQKWKNAIPQYNIGYESIATAIRRFENDHPDFYFCSNFYKGISVGDCVKNSIAVAERLIGRDSR